MITFKRGSILGQFYTLFGRNEYVERTDICKYAREVAMGMLLWVLAVIAGVCTVFMSVTPWIWAYGLLYDVWAIVDSLVPPDPGLGEFILGLSTIFGLMAWVMGVMGVSYTGLGRLFGMVGESYQRTSEGSSAFRVWVDSVKEKKCVFVKIEN